MADGDVGGDEAGVCDGVTVADPDVDPDVLGVAEPEVDAGVDGEYGGELAGAVCPPGEL